MYDRTGIRIFLSEVRHRLYAGCATDQGVRKMLSFDNKIHILSNHSETGPLDPDLAKESIFRTPSCRGTLSVEAALVVPLFLFFLLTLLSSLQLLSFSIRLQQVLFEEGMNLGEKVYENGAPDESRAVSEILSKLQVNGRIPVEGGVDGLDFSGSNLSDREFVDLNVHYRAKLLFDPFQLFHREFCQNVLFHTWIGYENGLDGRGAKTEEIYVYVTEGSQVYHRSRECTHIRLKITDVSGSDVGTLRNVYGDRYKSCRHCHAKRGDATLYVTPEGDCYHNSLSCSGLSRSVRAIPLREVGNRRPCSRCGY